MGSKRKPVQKSKRVQKTRSDGSGGTEVYFETETYTAYETVYEPDTSSSGGYDSGTYSSDSSSY